MSNMSNNNNIKDKDVAMVKQLELRTYSRKEIADVLKININDVNHFKRNVENKLNKWGYSYEYSKRQFKILKAPTSADERLAEIMIRCYDMDIRTDTVAFATFFYSLVVFPEFNAMPWEERSKWLEEEFEIYVSDRTLRSWCSKLIKNGTIIKNDDYRIRWVTGYCNGQKYRELIDEDNKELVQFADEYKEYMKKLLKLYQNLPQKEKWQNVRQGLWEKYKCCIYYCKGLQFSAWDNQMSVEVLQEVIELINEIAEREPTETKFIMQQSIETISKK